MTSGPRNQPGHVQAVSAGSSLRLSMKKGKLSGSHSPEVGGFLVNAMTGSDSLRQPIVTILLCLLIGADVLAQEFACAGFEPPINQAGTTAKSLPTMRVREPRGRHHALVIFAKFKGERPDITTAPDHAEALFDPNRRGSLSHFYKTMSFGQMELSATVLPKRYTSDRGADSYLSKASGKRGKFDQFASEILRAVDEDVDFAQFDNDGPDGIPNSGDDDGYVDYVFINLLSTPRDFIIGGATGVAGLRFEEHFPTTDTGANGEVIYVNRLARAGSMSREGGFSQTVGTMAHEFGHALGLPDLYDLKYAGPEEDSAGIGKWGLMGWGAHGWNGEDGPNPFSAWSLKQLGWVGVGNGRLVRIESDVAELPLGNLFDGGNIYQVFLPAPLDTVTYNRDPDQREQLLIETRSANQFYGRNAPGHGVLVWHAQSESDNYTEQSKLVDLVSADGLFADAGYPLGAKMDGQFRRGQPRLLVA